MNATIIVALLAASLALPLPAEGHCYRHWQYPWPQNCGAQRMVHHNRVVHSPVVAIPLPDMSAQWGGALETPLELSLQRIKAIRQLYPADN